MADTRQGWSSGVEFILTCIGYSVGLGNIWRFPYLCFTNGGGAFLIPYLLMLFLCGLPMACLEFSMGQYVGMAALPFWDICPLFKGTGTTAIILNFTVAFYHSFVIILSLHYFVSSFSSELPWKTCGHEWNTDNCYDGYQQIVHHNSTASFNLSTVSWLLFYLPVIRGVKSYGKAVYITATLPYVVLTVFVIRGALLPGSLQGIKYYLLPRWERLLDFKVWFSAASQIFYSLGIAFGAFITMASYNKFNNNCIRDAVVASLANSATSIYAGFAVFSVLGFMAHESNLDIEEVIQSGTGLAYIVYPRAMATLPFSQLWSVLFFFMLTVLGISTQCVHIETVVSCIVDNYPVLRATWRRILTGLVIVVIFVLLGIIFTTQAGMYYFILIDWYGLPFGLATGALIECVVFGWIHGLDNISADIQMMTGSQPSWFFKICWKFVSPLILLLILICNIATWTGVKFGNYIYPSWTLVVGWFLAVSPLLPIPVIAIRNFIRQEKNNTILQRFKILLKPSEDILRHIKERCMNSDQKSQSGGSNKPQGEYSLVNKTEGDQNI